LENGPLFRVSLLRIAHDDHVMMLAWHQIVNDGWSARLISEELAIRYKAARLGTRVTLPDLAVQAADYAAWQRDWLRGAQAADQIGYWRKTLADARLLDFPADRPRAA